MHHPVMQGTGGKKTLGVVGLATRYLHRPAEQGGVGVGGAKLLLWASE